VLCGVAEAYLRISFVSRSLPVIMATSDFSVCSRLTFLICFCPSLHEQRSKCEKTTSIKNLAIKETHISCHGTCISACMAFCFRITASCHILAISVSTVLVYAFSLRPGAAFVDIFCYATRYVSHCGCVDVCRISSTVLVLITLL
jgi:hypothetical protein